MRLGLFTDLHYACGIREGTRFCQLGLQKLQIALGAFAAANVDAIIGLGDLIDSSETPEAEADHLRDVCRLLATAGRPVHLIPGNHCIWTLTKAEYLAITRQQSTWGHIELHGWELIFLDACFRSDGVSYGRRNNDWKDAFLPADQLDLLRTRLLKPGHPALIFIHQRLEVEPPYGVKNAPEIRSILEQSGRVRGVFQGHEHAGANCTINGIRYLTLPAMVEGNDLTHHAFRIIEVDAGTQTWSAMAVNAR